MLQNVATSFMKSNDYCCSLCTNSLKIPHHGYQQWVRVQVSIQLVLIFQRYNAWKTNDDYCTYWLYLIKDQVWMQGILLLCMISALMFWVYSVVVTRLLLKVVFTVIAGVSTSSRCRLVRQLVLKKSTWEVFSSERFKAELLPLAFLVVI